jgi:hypothetical protein
VFDHREFEALSRADIGHGFAMVEVLRDGQTIVVSLPKGDSRLTPASTLASDIQNRLFSR